MDTSFKRDQSQHFKLHISALRSNDNRWTARVSAGRITATRPCQEEGRRSREEAFEGATGDRWLFFVGIVALERYRRNSCLHWRRCIIKDRLGRLQRLDVIRPVSSVRYHRPWGAWPEARV
ncbi:hypothetical protein NDU88_006314 [Pleurodeles waltl]|uniref:Uncharacterized protein n=1 Tax=Pleurodeles waltl TaxID=8319 RepID=A0AAV7L3R4_PLEWA|nr:hypothetical protein NDU88_006314 [Pleurodeles waltl]